MSVSLKAQYLNQDKSTLEKSIRQLLSNQEDFLVNYYLNNNACDKYELRFKNEKLYLEFKRAIMVDSKKLSSNSFFVKNIIVVFDDNKKKITYKKI